jgi:hypothetical protein
VNVEGPVRNILKVGYVIKIESQKCKRFFGVFGHKGMVSNSGGQVAVAF